MTFEPTPEQTAVVDAAASTPDNLLVSALAGAAKTSTLVLIAQALSSTSTLCLAFNKRIAEEMTTRLPGNCTAMTLNSLGHRTWMKALGRGLRVESRKNYGILKQLVDVMPRRQKDEAWDSFSDILKMVAAGKTAGWIPNGHYEQAKRLMNDEQFFLSLDEEPEDWQMALVRQVTIESLKQAFAGTIDFDDQILLPTVFPVSFPAYPLVLVDEAQDLSALNHATLRKLARQRLMAVGDECQAIYGFRGAHADSMPEMESAFGMRKLTLSVSFRCPQSVVREAQWRAPHMQWPTWAIEGAVSSLDGWSPDDLPDSATVICRNNAPLFALALKLLRAGRYPEIRGNDLGKNLIRTMKKWGQPNTPQAVVFDKIAEWTEEKLRKSRTPDKVEDQAACFRIFAEQGEQLGDAIAYAEHIMSAQGPIQLMTGHKSKGLEFDNVFILDKHLVRKDKEPQEANLLYVMITRSKNNLTYITSEGFTP